MGPLVGRFDKCEPRSILVIDNATIHQRIREIIEHPSVGEKVVFTAPYSPDLNPVEYMFNSYKSALKKYCREEWDVANAYGIESVTLDIARSYFRHCGIPRCENYPSIDELKEVDSYKVLGEAIGTAATVVVL